MTKSWITQAFQDPLGRRLVILSLLFSTILSTVAAGVQLTFSYQRQRSDVFDIFEQIEEALAAPLETALWKFDFGQVDVILDSIFANDAVVTLTLEIPSGQNWLRGAGADFDLKKEYDLIHKDRSGRSTEVGTLVAYLSLQDVNELVSAQFRTLLISNLIKAYLSTILLLCLFYFLVNRHLKAIARYVGETETKLGDQIFQFDRKRRNPSDDLDNIASALNIYRQSLTQKIRDLETEVDVRKRAEAKAQKAFEVRKTFLANMSHEVRTPLNAIIGLFQLIQMSNVPVRQKKQAEVGLKASHHLLEQLVNVLEISRMEADALEITVKQEPLKPMAEQWLQTALASLQRHDKDLEIKLQLTNHMPDTWPLDARRVTQIVNNLTDNAIKFTQTGKVHIQVDVTGAGEKFSELEICVLDTGVGIPESQHSAIFERFTQVDSGQTRHNGGSGLGLSISKELADRMGCILSVKSLPVKSCYSTEFTLRVPWDVA